MTINVATTPSSSWRTTDLPSRLREARERAQLTQRDVAAAVGATTVSVANWENGRHLPSPVFRRRLVEVLELELVVVKTAAIRLTVPTVQE